MRIGRQMVLVPWLFPNLPEFLKTVEIPVDQACKRAEIQKKCAD